MNIGKFCKCVRSYVKDVARPRRVDYWPFPHPPQWNAKDTNWGENCRSKQAKMQAGSHTLVPSRASETWGS